MEPRYNPHIFVQDNMEAAKAIILTPECGLTTQQRWDQETPWLMERIAFRNDEELVIDYGCGIGRIAKLLKNPVLGIDISPPMRHMAEVYTAREGFATAHSLMLQQFVKAGLRAHGAIAIWALQHVFDLEFDVQLLHRAIKPGGILWTLNQTRRYIPAIYEDDKFTWIDDGKSVIAELEAVGFEQEHSEIPPADLCQPGAELIEWLRL